MTEPRRILVLDTATEAVITGAVELDTELAGPPVVVAQRIETEGRRHAEVATTLIAEVLDEAGWRRDRLDAVLVGCGPGPFTGLRVGMATAAAFADALDLPAYPVCTLDGIAYQELAEHPDRDELLVVTDARRREVYWARYSGGRRVDGPGVLAPDELAAELVEHRVDAVVGTPAMAEKFDLPRGTTATPTPLGLVLAVAGSLAGGTPPEPLTPLYLRRPDALTLAERAARDAARR